MNRRTPPTFTSAFALTAAGGPFSARASASPSAAIAPAAPVSTAPRRTALSAFTLFAILAFSCLSARAEYAVLRSGQRLHITGWQSTGDTVRLDLDGGSVTLAATDLVSVEPEDVFTKSADRQADVPYGEQIRTAAATYGVDPDLVASVIAVESNFNSRAVSRKSAQGLMQLLPETSARLSVHNAFDPQQNINGGTRYLKELMERYGQNLALALAAYNAGPNRVKQYRGVPPYAETRNYVDRVTKKLRAQRTTAGLTLNTPSTPQIKSSSPSVSAPLAAKPNQTEKR